MSTINAASASVRLLKSFFTVADQNGDGAITKKELAATQKLVSEAQISTGVFSSSLKVDKVMKQLDIDADGSISSEEQSAAIVQTISSRKGSIQDLQKEYDVNGDGILQVEELKEMKSDIDKRRAMLLAQSKGEDVLESKITQAQAANLGELTLVLGRYALSVEAANGTAQTTTPASNS
jgi:Ca2+-binding EF-hand superfamily protein